MTEQQILAIKAALYCVAESKAPVIMIHRRFIDKQKVIDVLIEILEKEEGSEND